MINKEDSKSANKAYLILKRNENTGEWDAATPFLYDTLDEAQQSFDASFDYHDMRGEYRIIEFSNITVCDEITIEKRNEDYENR